MPSRRKSLSFSSAAAWPVDDETADPARGKIRNAIAVLQLLGDVEAVEEHHAGRALRSGYGRIGMHQQRRQARILVRYLHRLDAGMTDDAGGVLEDFHRLGVDVHAAR